MTSYILAFFCVICLVVGQLLFKYSATALAKSGSLTDWKFATSMLFAMCLYGLTSLAWVWVLQKVELGRVYPLMALGFVLVPLGSYFLFGERFSQQYLLGIGLIVVGIVVSIKS